MFEEHLHGVIDRITYRNEENGWTVLKVKPFDSNRTVSVVMFGEDVFVGKTFDFYGKWIQHKTYGRQFEAKRTVEKQPETLDALRKYLGSGLISGVGPVMANKIVKRFGKDTIDILDHDIESLLNIPGISKSKLGKIEKTWKTHRANRQIVQFLQENNLPISYASKLIDRYGDAALDKLSNDPYSLIEEMHGIGFIRADAIALSTGMSPQSPERVEAMVKYVLSKSKDEGNCYLLRNLIEDKLRRLDSRITTIQLDEVLETLLSKKMVMSRKVHDVIAYYDKKLYDAELSVAQKVCSLLTLDYCNPNLDERIVFSSLEKGEDFPLSSEQRDAIESIVRCPFSILTGGPGCGKTTTLRLLVKFLKNRKLKVMLAAPTGRAAQRMSDVVGGEAKTIHRLLAFNPMVNDFKYNEDNPLEVDFLIVDETSMLDIELSQSLFSAIGEKTQLLFIGDVDQLPSVGAGNVLHDLIQCGKVRVHRLSSVFRQAASSAIIRYAHELNKGEYPEIKTPFQDPMLWKNGEDCMFIDSEVATQEQTAFIRKVKKYYASLFQEKQDIHPSNILQCDGYSWDGFEVPDKFKYADLSRIALSDSETKGLTHITKRISPFSSIHYGYNALDMIIRLYCNTIKQYYDSVIEIQVLTPMTKGLLGTFNLNICLQQVVNPAKSSDVREVKVGKYVLREGDRVIQKRNNYNLEVFNGDIGYISKIADNKRKLGVTFKDKNGTREVVYSVDDFVDLDLAYAITIHKSQGSEFDAVIIPLAFQHFTMLTKNLVYTGMTRGKRLVVFVGNRGALRRASGNCKQEERLTYLAHLI
ncbi:AAA family ATPase [Halosquirtibacter laminarini]|uniref:AAA family ATPase n=1 Tax=Halosquirtibacter laminarini TaxID=3374600 RepID=A0AC61NNC3_9BACT|nr:AAA family ATPase [Prolixibacteraceae bacterium]